MRRHDCLNVYNSGKNSTSQALMYQHMSNHYRRILNAKKAVDASPPRHHKPKSPSPLRSLSPNKKLQSRNGSPSVTERSISSNSYGGSCWGTESCLSKKHNFSKRAASPAGPTRSDMALVDRITYDTKYGPAAYCGLSWVEAKAKPNDKTLKTPYDVKKTRSSSTSGTNVKRKSLNKNKVGAQKRKLIAKEKIEPDIMDRHSEFFASYNTSFYPRILKSDVVSKVRDLKVYHPPRRKANAERNSWMESEDSSRIAINGGNCKCVEICVCEPTELKCRCREAPKEQSQTSSRDSAYNGGISSLPESRSPTPDQRKAAEVCHCKSKIDSNDDESENALPSKSVSKIEDRVPHGKRASSRRSSVVHRERKSSEKDDVETSTAKYMSINQVVVEEKTEAVRKMKEDAMYTKLIQDITTEVLQKGLYTNKALKKVMKRHIISNLDKLDEDRMLKEVDNLRIQLGIPEDETLLDLNTVYSATDFTEGFQMISDSEFFAPMVRVSGRRNKALVNGTSSWTSHKFCSVGDKEVNTPPKTTSPVSDFEDEKIAFDSSPEEDDEELVSVIQVAKTGTEKTKADSSSQGDSSSSLKIQTPPKETVEHSADESDQSSDNRTKKKKIPQRPEVLDHIQTSSEEEGERPVFKLRKQKDEKREAEPTEHEKKQPTSDNSSEKHTDDESIEDEIEGVEDVESKSTHASPKKRNVSFFNEGDEDVNTSKMEVTDREFPNSTLSSEII